MHDRLVDDDDRKWFFTKLDSLLQSEFTTGYDELAPSGFLLYGDYVDPSADPRTYIEADTEKMDKIQQGLYNFLEDYNAQSGKPMHLVMFVDAVNHVSRICRVIRQPLGNALLLGVGGSGRQSLTRLAAFVEDFQCVCVPACCQSCRS